MKKGNCTKLVLINCQLTELIKSKLFFRGPHESWDREQGGVKPALLAKFGVRFTQAGKAREKSAQPLLSHFPGGCWGIAVVLDWGTPVESCDKLPAGHLLPTSSHRNAVHWTLCCCAQLAPGSPCSRGRASCLGTGRLPQAMACSGSPSTVLQPGKGPDQWQQGGTAACDCQD